MKINFIRHISDDILKQNQQLKQQVVQSKQTLSVLEDQLQIFLQNSPLPTPLIGSPHQSLQLFIRIATEQVEKSRILENQHQKGMGQLAQAQKQLIQSNEHLKKRKIQQEFRQKKWRQGQLASQNLQKQMKLTVEQLRQRQKQLQKELNGVEQRQTIEKMLIEQLKRKEVEDVRQFHHAKMMEMRDNLQGEHLQLEKELRKVIRDMDKKVKDMQKTITKLAGNLSLEDNQKKILHDLILAFQETIKTSKSIETLMSETYDLKGSIKNLQRRNLQCQSELKAHKSKQQNYQSQIQRQQLQRKQLQDKLNQNMVLIEQSQIDKQKMEDYYANKWNQQFNTVKTNLERTYRQKTEAAEKGYKQKQQVIERKMKECERNTEKYKNRNIQLQIIYKQDVTTKLNLEGQIIRGREVLDQARRQLEETWLLTREEILTLKENDQKEIDFLRVRIVELQQQIIRRQIKYEAITNRFNSQLSDRIQQTRRALTQQMKEKVLSIQRQKSNANELHCIQVNKLTQNISQLSSKVKQTKQQIIKDCQGRISLLNCQHEMRMKEKDEEWGKKLEKTYYRQKELELKLSSIRKQTEQEKQVLTRQMLRYQRQIQQIERVRDTLQKDLAREGKVRHQLRVQTQKKQQQIVNLKQTIETKEVQIFEEKTKAQDATTSANILNDKQSQWQQQVRLLREELRNDFEALKANFLQQEQKYQSKIWILEERIRQPMVSRKNYQKVKELQNQKQQLRTIIDIKQAQNIILNQVKDYYEIRFKQSESKGSQQRIPTKSILTRKLTRTRKQSCKNTNSSRPMDDDSEVMEMRKYITSYNKKQGILSRTRYNEGGSFFDRLKTNPL